MQSHFDPESKAFLIRHPRVAAALLMRSESTHRALVYRANGREARVRMAEVAFDKAVPPKEGRSAEARPKKGPSAEAIHPCVMNIFQGMMTPLTNLKLQLDVPKPSEGPSAENGCLNTSLNTVQTMIKNHIQTIQNTLQNFVQRLKNSAKNLGMEDNAFQEVLVRCVVKVVSTFIRLVPFIPDGIFDMMDNIVVVVIKKRYLQRNLIDIITLHQGDKRDDLLKDTINEVFKVFYTLLTGVQRPDEQEGK